MSTRINVPYFAAPFDSDSREEAIDLARDAKERIKFDTLAVTGVSGVVMGGLIAHALDVNLLIIRKPGDRTHSTCLVEGHLGARWAFLDDFVELGATRKRVRATVRRLASYRDITTTFVGSVLYESHELHNGNNRLIDY